MKNFTKNGAPPLPHWAEVARREDLQNRPVLLRVLRALHQGKFYFAVEPIYCMRKQDVHFHEILLRLKDENGKSISPLDVFSTVSDNDMSEDVALYLLYYQLLFRNVMDSTCSMNVSPLLLDTPEGRERFWQLLEGYAAEGEADKVILEILETRPLAITPQLITFMKEVAALGYKWSLDDFGDGHHSLDHIHDLPLDYVKLCARYSKKLSRCATPTPVVQAALQTCRNRGIAVVAENIRTVQQMGNLYGWHDISLSQSYDFPGS